MQPPQTKNSYHPYILVAYYLNCLPENIISDIPRSTRFDWQHRDVNKSFGYDWFKQNEEQFHTLKLVAQNKKLLALNKALLRVIAIKRFVEINPSKINASRIEWKKVVVNNLQKVTRIIGVSQTLRYLNFNFQYYAKLKRKIACASSSVGLCRIKHPTQLLQREIATIKKYCEEVAYQFWSISAIYHQMIKDGVCHMNLSTFYKYASLLNLKRSKIYTRRKNHTEGIRAIAPLEILHADLTEFKTEDNQKAYIYLVQDNFSRAILSHQVSKERRANHTFENLAKVKAEYLLPSKVNECILLTDDGSENYGEAKKWIEENGHPKINHFIAQVDVQYSNSMIEAANKQLKYRFLYCQKISGYPQLEQYVCKAVLDFNNRPHHVLHGLSPMEVLNGKRYDVNIGKKLIQLAKQNRINKNQKLKCCFG